VSVGCAGLEKLKASNSAAKPLHVATLFYHDAQPVHSCYKFSHCFSAVEDSTSSYHPGFEDDDDDDDDDDDSFSVQLKQCQ